MGFTLVTSADPVRTFPARARLAQRILRLFGWRVVYRPPLVDHAIIIVYPHTSNWDFPIGVLTRAAIRLPVRWIGKHTLFRGPMGPLMRGLGGIAVDRSAPQGLIDNIQREFAKHARFFIAITPEGTRSYTPHWKSGFYRLALTLNVPVGLAFIDYARREVGITEWMTMTGNATNDLQHIREMYCERRGKHPELAGEIRFRE